MHHNLTGQSTINDVMVRYLQVNRRIESNTRDLTERALGYAVEAVGNLPIEQFGYQQAEQFQAWLVHAPDGKQPKRNGTTANIYTKTARPVFRWAMRLGVVDADPFELLPEFKVAAGRIRVFESDEFTAMLAACPTQIWQARVLLAKTAGLRRGEALNLTTNDVDFENGIIHVQAKKNTPQTWAWKPKDTDLRELPLVKPLENLLTAILEKLPPKQPYLLLTPNRYKRLMQLKNAGLMWDRLRVCPDENFTKPFSRILRKAGVKSGTFHDLRRTCITEWLENGLKPHEVMGLAGHSDIDTTMRYYVTTRRQLLDRARQASQTVIGVTGLEPATS